MTDFVWRLASQGKAVHNIDKDYNDQKFKH